MTLRAETWSAVIVAVIAPVGPAIASVLETAVCDARGTLAVTLVAAVPSSRVAIAPVRMMRARAGAHRSQ